jgi:hypothetical protein
MHGAPSSVFPITPSFAFGIAHMHVLDNNALLSGFALGLKWTWRSEPSELTHSLPSRPPCLNPPGANRAVKFFDADLYGHSQPDRVVWRMEQILPCPEVAFGRLHRGVAEQHLDLLKFPAGRSTQLCTGPPQIVWRDAGDADFCRILPQHRPYDILAEALAGNGARSVHRAKQVARDDSGGRRPRVDGHLDPVRYRRGPNAAVLPD